MISYKQFERFIYEYLSYVFEHQEYCKNDLMDEDKFEEFIMESTNNWENGYDLVDWIVSEKKLMCDNIFDDSLLSYMYNKTKTWYIEEDIIEYVKHFNKKPNNVVRHYLYYFVNSSPEEIKEKLMEMV